MMITPEVAVFRAVLLCLAGALAALVLARNKTVAGWVALLFTAASAALIFSAVTTVCTAGPSAHPETVWSLSAIGLAVRLHVDGLSAWFLMLAAGIAVPAMLFSIAYLRNYPGYSVARYYPYFLVFLAAMYGLVSTTDMMWVFFIFWQMMTLPGYALIRFEHEKPENLRAANKFMVMMQIACGLAMAGAAMLAGGSVAGEAGASRYDIDALSANLPALLAARPAWVAAAFALFLAGFGIKMGMWPFGQLWLPDAHPAAPSPVSAMLSGVMIKTGVYGLIRYFMWLVPADSVWGFPSGRWGLVIAVLGTITLLTGTLQALQQEQTKRLLAFHSIGQVGYILLGFGVCLALLPSTEAPVIAVAAAGFYGALFHTLNHGIFKSLLFLNAGAIGQATGTQDLNRLGGLRQFMPATALTALIASLAISGVPLFNGFASKWCIYLASILGSAQAGVLAFCGVLAILTSVLTLASFIKFYGAIFLSRASGLVLARAAQAKNLEVGWQMRWPQYVLAALCVVLGLVPMAACQLIQQMFSQSWSGFSSLLAGAAPFSGDAIIGMDGLNGRAVFVPGALLLVFGLLLLAAYGLMRLGGARRRAVEPWLCGYATATEQTRYPAHHFYGEFKRWFTWIGGQPQPPPPAPVAPPKNPPL